MVTWRKTLHDSTRRVHCSGTRESSLQTEKSLYGLNKLLDSGSDIEKINNLKKQLSKQFAMKDLGAAKQILGMRIIRDKANGTLKLSQSEYVKKVLSRFNMNEVKPVSTPLGSHFKLSKEQSPKTKEERDHMSKVPYASAIGSLMYAMVCTRPDIAHAVGVVSRFMSRPGKQHWEAVKWILRYLKGSLDTCLCFTGGTAISWTSNLQKIVTLSTTEAEYVAATEAGKEMIWLHGFLDELGKKQEMGILHSDSQSAIFLAKNSAFHSKSKHIQTKYHFIRYLVEDKLVILEKICGSKNPADMLTKGVTIEKLKLCATSIGGHTIGTSACQFFRDRLFNFNTTTGNGADPSIDPAFLPQLQALCPQNGDANRRVALDTVGSEVVGRCLHQELRAAVPRHQRLAGIELQRGVWEVHGEDE
ncbi:Retrovirus-related Pol polyprotein from transposon TNT 1-94 [Vitis vinifera]|uniref:Retrovirus-related Pol polyprotein from transposon TNT 1-94 n=1 Tax=Vitis vinifera TaxID=29760 RepID=A0A438CLY0_VITVI|nr:Retrovirus-related Pol polyprotein from transposon TNT 1-94 [Vitis vinifera]